MIGRILSQDNNLEVSRLFIYLIMFKNNFCFVFVCQQENELLELCAYRSLVEEDGGRLLQLLQDDELNINCLDSNGRTPLMLLCCNNTDDNLLQFIEVLLNRKNVDINREDSSNGLNALSALCVGYRGQQLPEIIRLLIQNGSRLYSAGSSALHSLFSNGGEYNLLETVRALVEGGAAVDSTAPHGSSVLHALCTHQHDYPDFMAVLSLFIEQGTNINSKDEQGRTALHIICAEHIGDDLIDIIRFLIENRIDVKAKDDKGVKAVHLLKQRGFPKSSEVYHLLRS